MEVGFAQPSNYSGENYSTVETIIGTWIDGKPIYQKTIFGDLTTNTAWNEIGFIQDIGDLVYAYGTSYKDGSFHPIPTESVKIRVGDDGPVSIAIYDSWFIGASVTVTVQYTKTTDEADV